MVGNPPTEKLIQKARPPASISLDLDNKWAYLRAAGHDDWESKPSYLPLVIDRIVQCLQQFNLPLSVFIVGRDLVDSEDCNAIRSFSRLSRWEPANHSLNHLPWLHLMQPSEIADEIETTHQRIVEVTGRTPVGFRGPGFSCPDEVLKVLCHNGYQYDASVFPTSVAPLARAVFLLKSNLKGAQRERAKKLYGGFSSFFQPNRPFKRTLASELEHPVPEQASLQINNNALAKTDVIRRELWELPVTVMPFIRTPIHFSYFTFLASISESLARFYFTTALQLCRLTNTPPSLLLHPLDFMSQEDDQDMAYFPGMKLNSEKKQALVHWALEWFSTQFDVRCMIDSLELIASGEVSSPADSRLSATTNS